MEECFIGWPLPIEDGAAIGFHLAPRGLGFKISGMTDEQSHALHERIFEQMLEADWLASFSFTNNKGWHPTWTVKGAKRALELSRAISVLGLNRDDRAALEFTLSAQGGANPGAHLPAEYDPPLAARWLETIAELGIRIAEDDLRVLVHIILNWGGSRSHS
jgi:hypothetical protein